MIARHDGRIHGRFDPESPHVRVLERDSRAIDPRSGLAVCVREVSDGLSSGGRISRVDYDQTREVLAAFERERVDYVVFGGVAMNRMKKDRVRPRDLDARGTDGPGAVSSRGVHAVSSESADALREVWEQANFDAFRARRKDRR